MACGLCLGRLAPNSLEERTGGQPYPGQRGARVVQRRQILRVRSTPDGVLTWKGMLPEQEPSGHKVRREFEVHVAAQEVDTLLQLLEGLGFTEVLRYEKARDTWQWRGVQVMLDSLVFGQFVEIEGDAVDIDNAVKALGLESLQPETRSYPELQRQYQESHKSS